MQKGLLRHICLWLYMIQTGGIKLMWTCNSNKKPSPDKRSNSNTEMKNLKGNCTHEHKVPKKANLITLQAYQSYKYQKTKHKKINSPFTFTLEGMCCYCKCFTVTAEIVMLVECL